MYRFKDRSGREITFIVMPLGSDGEVRIALHIETDKRRTVLSTSFDLSYDDAQMLGYDIVNSSK